MELYFQPHDGHKKETAFVQALINKYDIDNVVASHYPIPRDLNRSINLIPIVSALESNLPRGKRWSRLCDEISELPNQVQAFINPSYITCDVVIVRDGKPHFIEFHEKQHRTLHDKRAKKIFDIEGNEIIVSRFLQRFLKDIWRIERLDPFMVMWDDVFIREGLERFQLIDSGFAEYSNRFSFSELMGR